jgi:hypothetical protein
MPDLTIFKILPTDLVTNSTFTKEESSTIIILLEFDSSRNGEVVELEFIPDESKYTCGFQFE